VTAADLATGGASMLTRMAATGVFVLMMGWLIANARPAIAAAAIGLPVVMAPGFAVMAMERSDAFVADAARGGLGALAGTAAFAATVAALAGRSAPAALGAGVIVWAGVASGAQALVAATPGGWGGALAWAAAWLALARQGGGEGGGARGGWRLAPEAARAAAAGLVVGAVTLTADRLGPGLSGAMLTLPVGMIFVALSLMARGRPALTAAVMRGGVRGTAALAAFMAVVAAATPSTGALAAVGLATAASCLTAALIGRAGARRA
jgi:hypothetical protein